MKIKDKSSQCLYQNQGNLCYIFE